MSFGESSSFVPTETGSAWGRFRVIGYETANAGTQNIASSLAALERLRGVRANWDGHESAAPSTAAIDSARTWVAKISNKVSTLDKGWVKPHVSSDEEGVVVLEWWYRAHKLTIYVAGRSARYIKVWGPDIFNEMEDGDLTEQNIRPLWRWLTEQ